MSEKSGPHNLEQMQGEIAENKVESRENTEACRTAINPFYDIVIDAPSETSSTFDITIQDHKTQKRVVSLGELISTSSRIVFQPGDIYEAIEWGAIKFPFEDLKDPREIFGVLHELGHLEDIPKMSPQDKHFGSRLKAERNAWANAIKYGRRIKREHGINLFKLFDSVDEFMGFIRLGGLRDYEESAGKPPTKTRQVELWEARKWDEIAAEIAAQSEDEFKKNPSESS